MFLITLIAVIVGLEYTSAQSGCDFYQQVQVGAEYEVKSPNHPASYPPQTTCRWIATCPPGYNCLLNCYNMRMPATTNCNGDRVLVSATGDPYLYGATVHCGTNPFVVVSSGQTISVGLITGSGTTGSFLCSLRAQLASQPPETCSCGERKQNRIVGGQETGVNEYISMAAIVRVSSATVKCGTTIIDKNWVVTAAHCVADETTSSIVIVVGDHNISTGADTSAAKGYQVQRIILHPQYDSSNYNNDIAVLKTTTSIVFSAQVGPACLPFKFYGSTFAGSSVTLLGWGTVVVGGPTSKVLRKVDVTVISQERCRSYFPQVTNNQICTLTPGKDACQYDSGGPGLYTDPYNGRLYLALIISFGRFCASNEPAINTRVTEKLDWLQSTTGANFCKI